MLCSPFLDGIGLGTEMCTPEENKYFNRLVRDFTHRSLSFDRDAEGAFAGLLNILSEKTGAHF